MKNKGTGKDGKNLVLEIARWPLLLPLLLLIALSGSAQTCPASLLNWTSNDIAICENETEAYEMGDIISTSGDFDSWSWTPPGTFAADTLLLDEPFSIVGADWVNAGDIEVVFFSDTDTCALQLSVEVLDVPDASFTVVDDGFCADLPVDFDLDMDPDLVYSWNFGDGSTSGEAQPSHVYNSIGSGTEIHNVTLTVTNGNGCSATNSTNVSVLELPDIGISELGAICASSASFPMYTELVVSPDVSEWVVDWGNGEVDTYTSSGPFSTSYDDDFGYYPVTIVATGLNGCISTLIDDVFVGNNPQVGSDNPGNTNGLCGPYDLTFPINNIANNVPGTVYTLDYGDGNADSFIHDLPASPPASVTHTYNTSSCGFTTPEGSNNAFRLRLEATNECGTSVITVDPIRIHETPNVQILGPTGVCTGQPFAYTVEGLGEMVTEANCEVPAVSWTAWAESGQAPPSTTSGFATNFTTTFPEPGGYALDATPFHSNCDNVPDTLEVCAYPQLEAIANALPFSGCAPLVVNLENLSPMPAICGTPEVEWTISGGDHTYLMGDAFADIAQVELLEAGTYTIEMELRIPNKGACPSDFVTFNFEVFEPPSLLIDAPGQICQGAPAQATIFSLDEGNTALDGWQWSVDGSNAANTQTPLDLPTDEPGFHTVTGLASNLCGTDEHTVSYEVLPEPEITFNLPGGPDNCAGDTVEVWASGVDTYTWANSPAIVSNALDDSNILVTGDANITLQVDGVGANNCPTTNNFVVPMAPLPTVSLTGPAALCPGADMVLTAAASGGSGAGYSFDWQVNDTDFPITSDQISLPAPPTASSFDALVEVTDGFGCSADDAISWTTLDAPTVDAGPDTTFCLDLTGTYSLDGFYPGLAEAGGDGLWTGDGLSNAGAFEPNAVGLFEAVYAYTDAQGCSSTDTLLIEVVDLAPLVPGTPPEACFGAQPFVIDGFGPATASWSGTGVTPGGEVNPAAAGVGATTLVLSQGVGSCYQEETVTLVVHPLPEPVLNGPPEICNGEPFTITGSEAGGAQIFWEGESTAATEYAVAAASGPGTTTIEALAISAEGCEASAGWDVDVLALPQVSLAPFPTVCDAGLAVTLDQGQPQGGTWSGPGVVGDAWTPVGAGVADLVYTYQDPLTLCENSVAQAVDVQALVQAEAGPNLVICDIDTTILLVGGPDNSGFWSGDFVAGDDVLDANSLPPGDHPYVYTLGEATCETTDTLMLTVHHRPEVTLTASDMDPCLGDTVFLTAAVSAITPGPHAFEWWDNVTETAAVEDTSWAFWVVTDDGVLPVTVSVTDDNGCSRLETLTIDVLPLPTVEAGDDLTLCNQPPAEVLMGMPVGGVWSAEADLPAGALVGGTLDPALAGLGTFALFYEYTDGAGCTNVDSMVVEVEAPQFADAGPDTSFCNIAATGMVQGFSPATGGVWSGTGIEENGGFDIEGLIPGQYEWTYEYGSGTCFTSDIRILTIHENPDVELASSAVAICEGDSIHFTSTTTGGAAPYNYVWSSDVEVLGDTAAWQQTQINGLGTALFTHVTVTDQLGCTAAAGMGTQVWLLPVVEAGDDLTLCDQPIVETLGGFAPAGGLWSGSAALNGAAIDPSAMGEGAVSLTYTYTDGNGCTNADSLVVEVVAPVVAEAGADLSFCDIDSTGVLTGFVPTSGTWSGPGIAGASGAFDIDALVPGVYNWSIEFGQGTCYTKDSITVTILENPDLELLAEDAQVCDGEMAFFEGVPADGLPPYDWIWSPNVTPTGAAFAEAQVEFAGENPLQVQATVADANGCQASDNFTINVLGLPNVSAGSDTTLCATGIEAILGPATSVSGSGVWTSIGGGNLSADGVITPTATGNWSAVYTFAQDVTGCVNSDTLQVEVIDAVQVAAGPDTVACFNAPPVTFAGVSPGSGVSWVPVDPATSVSGAGTVAPAALGPGVHAFEALYGVATCLTRDTVEIEVLDLPTINMPAAEAFCGNLGVQPLGSALPAGGVWFGDGVVDAAAGTFNTEMPSTDYTPGYHCTDPLTGCRDTSYHAVTVHPVPVAAFDLPALGCTNGPVDLVQQSTGFSDQTWSFPPYPASTEPLPAFTYPTAGEFTIGLLVANAFGCADSTTADLTVTVPPVADFSMDVDLGCTPLEVNFANLSTAPFADTTWTIDGVVQPGAVLPVQTFSATGDVTTYVVGLQVENVCGVSTAEGDIEVTPLPEAAFFIPQDTVCSPYTNVVLDASVGVPESWSWDFGNGNTSTSPNPGASIYQVDSLPEGFDITLEVTNGCGADDTTLTLTVLPNAVTAFFTTNTSGGCAPFTLEVTDVSDETVYVSYDFGNGDFSNSTPVASTTYDAPGVYVVQQFVSDGCSADTTSTTVTVSESPEIELVVPGADCASESFAFAAEVSTAVGSAVWTFGDGTDAASGLQATHNFPGGGSYWVTFETASALDGCPAVDSAQVTVHPVPTADWMVDPMSGCSPFEVAFENLSTGTGLNQTWDFGDGSDGETDAEPSHTYTNTSGAPVLHEVTLTVNNAYACSAAATGVITVLPAPVASFALAAEESCSFPVAVEAMNNSAGSVDHEWVWSGGVVVDAFEPEGLVADGVGVYDLTLTATNGYGCTDLANSTFTVHEAPTASFSANPTFGCNPLSVSFSNNSSNVATSALNIPGIFQGPLPPGNLVIDQVGTYVASLTVTSPEGCTDDVTLAGGVQVFPVPTAGFTVSAYADVPENTVFTFDNTSSTDFLLNWNFGDGSQGSGSPATHEYSGSGLFDVTLTAINSFGCAATHVETVDVGATIMVFAPTAFTPGGQGDFGIARPDGLNDGWRPEIRGMEHVNGYWLQVFNRWGELVWETRDPDAVWDGGMPGEAEERFYAQDEVLNWQLRLSTSGDVKFDGGDGADDGSRAYAGVVTILR